MTDAARSTAQTAARFAIVLAFLITPHRELRPPTRAATHLVVLKGWHPFELILRGVHEGVAGYHFSLADRAVVVPAVGAVVGEVGAVVVEGGAVVVGAVAERGSFTNLS